jgi:hypothetical protein
LVKRDPDWAGKKKRNGKREWSKGTDLLVYDCSEKLETWEDLSLWDRGLDDGRYLGDPNILGCYIVRSRYCRNVDICYELVPNKSAMGAHHSSFQPGSEE